MGHTLSGESPSISRRAWLAAGVAGLGMASRRRAGADEGLGRRERNRGYLKTLLYTREDLDAWRAGTAFPFSKYDPELGYLHIDRRFAEGVDGSICTYRYDPSGARRMRAGGDGPCRINSYGNSFTSCEQVSDGETWQEVLAAHLGEPIRNFGIGGYSVYQAYLRMRREEQRSPARYIIFNIFDDDHYRNPHGWQRLRFGMNRKSTNPPIPYVSADPDADTLVEHPNPCPTFDALYRLCDLESAVSIFGDDFALDHYARRNAPRPRGAAIVPGGTDFGDPELTRRAIFATTRIVEKVEEFAKREGRKVLYVLSFGDDRIRPFLEKGRRFDAEFVAFLDRRGLPYVDLMKAHADDYRSFAPGLDAYFRRYFIGHYNPQGNAFCAFAMKDKLKAMLEPPPPAYAPQPDGSRG